MSAVGFCVLLFVTSCILFVRADVPGVIIISGEHFDDLVFTKDGHNNVFRSTVLFLYEFRCPPQINLNDIPGPNHLYTYTYETIEAKQYIWYEPLPTDDLKERYASDSDDCQVVLFFEKGQSYDTPPLKYNPESDPDVVDWIWSKLGVEIEITNYYDVPLLVTQEPLGRGPHILAGKIEPVDTVTVPSYPGYSVSIKDTKTDHSAYNLVTGDESITVDIRRGMTFRRMETLQKRERKEYELYQEWQRIAALRYLSIMKQPLFVHNYTTMGFQKMRIPPMVYKKLYSTYIEQYDVREPEDMHHNEFLVVNKRDQMSSLIKLSEDMIEEVAEDIRPILEAFCHCKLRFNMGFGIREYYEGNVVFKHVDVIRTHVISAILQVEQELESGDWRLEAISWDGKRRTVKMLAGDMLLYESAKLIHSRPVPFEGKKYANCFFHFSPVEGWPYVMEGSDLVNTHTGQRETIDDLMTPFTHNKQPWSLKDEL